MRKSEVLSLSTTLRAMRPCSPAASRSHVAKVLPTSRSMWVASSSGVKSRSKVLAEYLREHTPRQREGVTTMRRNLSWLVVIPAVTAAAWTAR